MKIQCNWNGKMTFTAGADQHSVKMDTKSPLGSDSALSPKQLLLASICGCTAMDVVSLLQKYKEKLEALEIEADAPTTEGVYPAIFKEVKLVFKLQGVVDAARALESVQLSQTKYCGVSAMVSKAVPIRYEVELNGKSIGAGVADFK